MGLPPCTWWCGLCAPVTPRAMSAGAFRLLLGSPMPNRSKGRSQTKSNSLVLQVGLTTQPCKTRYVTETNAAVETYADGPPVYSSHPPGRMTTADEILPEVRSAMHNLLGPKNKIRLGTWNVQTMYATSKMAQRGNDTIESKLKPRIATVDSCFVLVGSRQHGVASCEVLNLAALTSS